MSADSRFGFLELIFGPQEGFLNISVKTARTGEWHQHFFRYPSDKEQLTTFLRTEALRGNVYFCPTILRKAKIVKENIDTSRVAWADLDSCEPSKLLVPPTVVVQTSPNRWQAYWVFNSLEDALDVEDINRRIAYHHKDDGCDQGGWDLTQRLRVPATKNHKYSPELHEVKIDHIDVGAKYDLDDFDVYPAAAGVKHKRVELPDELPEETAEEILEAMRMSINPRVEALMTTVPEGSWSEKLWQLELMLFTAGLSKEQVFIVVKEAACNKYERDQKSDELLWKEVVRAHANHENASVQLSQGVETDGPAWHLEDKPLLTDEEREKVKQRKTIVEEYIEWAKTVGDAAPQYHQAGAFTLLSALLAGRVRLPTSYGTIIPNMWFMILADTTLTRKTTAMDLAMDMLSEIDSDAILATDGSIEGLMRAMSTRSGRPSIFLRDEFSGLLEQMGKRDYYSGMLEAFTKLYDGKFQKRILSKEIIEVKEPVLIMFTGGIKSRIFSLLTPEHINSGFIPRFCFITAESDLARLRALGPPTEGVLEARDDVLERFRDIYNHYNHVAIDDDDPATVVFAKEWRATMTPDAWARYNKIEDTLLSIGLESSVPDMLTPVMVRLSLSGLKAALLIAASSRLDDTVVIHETDILHAFSFVESWKQHALNVVANAGKTAAEHQMERIYKHIQNEPGVLRSKLMQLFRLTARDADQIFNTLILRGLVRQDGTQRTHRLYPMQTTKIHFDSGVVINA